MSTREEEPRGMAAVLMGNGRSVLYEGWSPWLVLVGRLHHVHIYIFGGITSRLFPRRPN